MDKVYLVYSESGSSLKLERVFSNKIAAEKYKEQLEKETEDLKDSEYLRDCEIIARELFDDTYDTSWENKCLYENKHPQVLIHTVFVVEKTLY